jgi:glucose-1-phosphate thymidylyltransferase
MGLLTYDILDGWWTDCGTFDSLLRASNLVAKKTQMSTDKKHSGAQKK